MSAPSALDLPVSDLLRSGTTMAHQTVENSKGALSLTRGELDRDEYVRFLIMLYNVYDTLETALEQHASNPVLSPTYNPPLLARAPALLQDISHILGHPLSTIHSHPVFASLAISPSSSTSASQSQSLANLKDIPAGLHEYVTRLSSLAASPDPAPLLAHAYVRYLGDLSGGQVIKRRVQKAYGLEDDNGQGVRFYEFGKLGGEKGQAGTGDMKKIKEWYRDGMNAGVGDNKDLKVTIVAEANKAFELNQGLFASLRPPSGTSSRSSTPPPSAPADKAVDTFLGDPTSPTTEKPHTQLLQTNVSPPNVISQSTFTMSGVLSFLLALGIAHFALTVGGFTGSKGWEKYEAVEGWIAGLFEA